MPIHNLWLMLQSNQQAFQVYKTGIKIKNFNMFASIIQMKTIHTINTHTRMCAHILNAVFDHSIK